LSKFFIVAKSFPQRFLGKIFKKNFDGDFFTGIGFSLEILIENYNTNYSFPIF